MPLRGGSEQLHLFRQLTFEAPDDGTYSFSVRGDEGTARLRACASGCQSARAIVSDELFVHDFELEAGIYSVRFVVPMGEEAEYSLHCER